MSRRISEKLKLQLFCSVLISLLSGFIVFGISFLLGNTLLDKTVYGHSFADKMAEQQFSKLQDFVDKESISTNNLQRLNAWCSRGEKVYLTIYQDDVLIYESHRFDQKDNKLNGQEFDPNMEDPDSEYILTLDGDIKVRAFLYYYAGDSFYFWMTVFSGLFAFTAFSLCFVVLIGRKVAYISHLKKELDILSGGQLEYPITIKGKDELAELALGIDQMRQAIIRHQEVENQMRSANLDLITAMSHDLRTPLTSLLAYLEIIERKKYLDDRQLEELICKCVGQTMRIKHMADKLFEYFWDYSTEWGDVDMETVDADEFFLQILADYEYALESKGMKVTTDFDFVFSQIEVNSELLQRVMDNLYSNLLKYANQKETIWISYKRKGENLLLSITNGIKTEEEKTESTSIGLTTCRRIVEYHKGHFAAAENGGSFYVTVSLPIQ